jgi:hypothetical protein
MTMLATVYPDSWHIPLFIHVLGATILVGGVLTGASALVFARGNRQQLRFGYFSLLLVGLPGLILMRIGAAAIWSKYSGMSFFDATHPSSNDPRWIQIGGTVADLGGAGLVLALILGWIGVRRMDGSTFLTKVPVIGKMAGETLLKVTMVISLALLAGYFVAIWAMAGKPD